MPRLRSIGRLIVWTLLAILALVALLVAVASWEVHRSVPTLDGQAKVPGLQSPVTIARDERGTAVVKGANRLDVARGLGFVHAQERFFEMDLARRSASGELSELFGPLAIERDKQRRLHRMRAMLSARFAGMDAGDRALLQAYADGVNAGLAQLSAKPWQYMMLRAQPRAWSPVDSLLVIGEMFWMLQGSGVDEALQRAQWRACTPPMVEAWLEPRGGRWDGAIGWTRQDRAPMPGPEDLDLRKPVPAPPFPPQQTPTPLAQADFLPDFAIADRHEPIVGSNNWAVDGAHSLSGDAMLANDMHLGLSVPSTWFRAQFEIGSGPAAIRAEGVTLPGVPAMVVGSNGHVAWGFTNTYGIWFEWVDAAQGGDPAKFQHVNEVIAVKGGADVTLPVTLFDGMPVVETPGPHAFALNWVADQGAAYNLKLDDLLTAGSMEAATRIGAHAGIPEQNMLVADSHGAIAWTVAGALFAADATSGDQADEHIGSARRRSVRLDAEAGDPGAPPRAPVLQGPRAGLLWTANARVYQAMDIPPNGQAPDGPGLPSVREGGYVDLRRDIGDGGYDLGARAQQIRDRLRATPKFDETSLGAIHFDDEALFLRPWAGRIAAVAASPTARPEVTKLLADWNGRADADQTGYRLVVEVRKRVLDALWSARSQPLVKAGQCAARQYDWHARFEYAAEDVLDKQPAHLLPRGFASWDAFLLAQVDATVADMTRNGARPLAQATWGEVNRSHIGHVLSRALPILAHVLDMPSVPQSGDRNMPHVAAPAFGQSERLVVAPGHEERATLSMPGGQSGHPMSPYYGAGHADWVAGRATPLLAGAAQHVLTLSP